MAPRDARGSLVTGRRRLIFVNRYFAPDTSATSQMLFDLARRLVTSGYEVHVICSRQRYDDPGARLPPHEVLEGVQVHRVATTRLGRSRLAGRALDYLTFYASALACLLRISRKHDIVIAKTDPPMLSVPVAVVTRWRHAILVNWLQDLFPEVARVLSGSTKPGLLEGALLSIRDWSLRAAGANVVIGERMKEAVLRRGVPASSVHVIENWADGEIVAPIPVDQSRLRHSLGLHGKFVVGYSGNLGRAHEGDTILGAAKALKSRADIGFLMIGGGYKMEQLRAAAVESGLQNVIFLPYRARDELADSMAAADVHIVSLLPTMESFIVPSKIYGILAAGRPVIFVGDPAGEIAGIIGRGRCGSVVRIGDCDALARELVHMKEDASRCDAMGKAAREHFALHYTAERAADKWRQVLSALPAA
jgi:glycosyltransferase involved in cell wall biosynthesis